MSVNNPIVNARVAYVNGLDLSWLTTTTFSVGAGAASNSTNVNDIILSAPVTNLITFVGPNGVDVAAAVASSFYYVFVIGDSTEYQPTASLLSLSATPSLPFGYDMYRRIGFVLTDSGSHVLKFWQYGNGSLKDMWYDTPIATPAITTSDTYVTQSLAAGVPPIVCEAFLKYVYGANSAGNNFQIGPYGSIPTVAMIEVASPVVTGTATAIGPLVVPTALNSGAPTVEHKESSSSDTLALYVSGYRDSL